MFEWVDKTSGETIRLSPDEAAELLNKTFGRKVTVRRQGLWPGRLVVAASAGFLVLAATSWEFKQRKNVTESSVKREYFVEFLSWDLPPYRTEVINRKTYIQEAFVHRDGLPDEDQRQVFEIRAGKIVADEENSPNTQDPKPDRSVAKEASHF